MLVRLRVLLLVTELHKRAYPSIVIYPKDEDEYRKLHRVFIHATFNCKNPGMATGAPLGNISYLTLKRASSKKI